MSFKIQLKIKGRKKLILAPAFLLWGSPDEECSKDV